MKFKILLLAISIFILNPFKLKASDFEVNGVYYTFTSMSNLEVRLDSISYLKEEFKLVDKVEYKDRVMSVVSISPNSFSKAISLQKITIETDLTLPSSMFSGLTKLNTLILNCIIEAIPQNFCKDCINLKNLQLSPYVSKLNEGCFDGCKSLTFFSTIPAQITYIGKNSIRNNNINLKNMIIEDSSEPLYISDWSSLNIYPTKLYLGRNLISDYDVNIGKHITEISYSTYVNSLPNSFFYDNDEITTINLPETISTIPYRCFYDCDKLTNIVIPNSVQVIGNQAFANSGLSVFSAPSNLTEIGYRAFYNTKINYLKFNCPIETIGDEAFNKVQNVILPASLKRIEADTFGELKTLIIEQGPDTLWCGTKILSSSTVSDGWLQTNIDDAARSPKSICKYIKTFSNNAIENIKIGRPVIGAKISNKYGTDTPESSIGYYEYVNYYCYYPDVINPSVKQITIGEFKDTKISVDPDTLISYSYGQGKVTGTGVGWSTIKYIDRTFLSYGYLISPSVCKNLEVLNSVAIDPPILYEDFPNSVYLNAVLRVPTGSKENYENADHWKGFWNIEEVDFSNEDIWNLPISLEEIKLNVTEATLNISENLQLEVTPTPLEVSLESLVWTSSDETVASVNENGLVYAISEGEVTITATCEDVYASCKISVVKPIIEATQINLNVEEVVLKINENLQLEVSILPEDTTDPTVIWASSDDKIATVSDEGLVTALKEGETTIIASCGEVSAECKVYVVDDSGIESILDNSDEVFTIYTLDGILIQKDCTINALKELETGIYIIVQGDQTKKISIK